MYGVVSFGGGSRVWLRAGRRLSNQINQEYSSLIGKVYDEVPKQISNNSDLRFIEKNKRGYGYWIWKPMVILDFLKNNQEVDRLIYLDAGCELSLNQETIIDFFGEYEASDAVVFYMSEIVEQEYSKTALLSYLNTTDIQKNEAQISATVFCMQRSFAESFANNWLTVMRSKEYSLVNDSLGQEIDSFIDHRHDQSVFSLLIKKTRIQGNITEIPIELLDSEKSPVKLVRNRSRLSVDDGGIFVSLYKVTERVLDKLFSVLSRIHYQSREE